MKRSIRVRMNFVVDVEEGKEGIPCALQLNEALERAAKAVIPQATYLHPGGRVEIGLTRESVTALRRMRKTDK